MELFKLSAVQVQREHRIILDITSLSMVRGSLYVLVGENGAGKTTLLKVLSRQLDDYAGTIAFEGADIQQLNRVDYTRRVHYVFQHPRFLQGSVMRNLLMPLSWRGNISGAEQQQAENLLVKFGLDKLASQPASSLSGGEAQRLSLARALLLDPDVLLVDEPTANVDEENAKFIASILQEAAATGRGVVVATHDPLLMKNGQILRLSRGRIN